MAWVQSLAGELRSFSASSKNLNLKKFIKNNIKWQSRSVFSDRLNMISHEGRYTPNWESDSFKVQRFDETRGRNIFYDDFPVEQFGGKKIEDFINGNGDNTGCKSVIFELDQLLERKKAQEVKGDE